MIGDNIYVAVGIIGVLIVLLIAQCIKTDKYEYNDVDNIMVKTGRGIIKISGPELAGKIAKIISQLEKKKCNGADDVAIIANKHLSDFINANPVNGGPDLYDAKANIIHKIEMGDLSSGVMSDVNSVVLPYDNFIKKLKIVHEMLISGLCNGGLLDYKTIDHVYNKCMSFTPEPFENDVGNIIV